MPTVLKQLTIKTVGSEPRAAAKQNKKLFLCRIYGEASYSKTKEGKTGDPYSLLIGAFRAEVPLPPPPPPAELPGMPDPPPAPTVKVFESDTLLLPGGIEQRIEKLLKTSGGKPVQFGLDVFALPDPAAITGFSYESVEVLAPVNSDHLTAIGTAVSHVPLPGTHNGNHSAPAGPNQDLPPVAQLADAMKERAESASQKSNPPAPKKTAPTKRK